MGSGKTAPVIDSDIFYQKAIKSESVANYDSAIYYYKQAYQSATTTLNHPDQVRFLTRLSSVFSMINQTDSAWHYIMLAEKIYKSSEIHDQLLMSALEQGIGSVLLDRRNMDSALFHLNRSLALRLGNNGPEDTLLAVNYNLIGNYFWYKNNIDSSLFYYRKALKQTALMNQKENKEVAKYNQNIGIALASMGIYDEAEIYLIKSLTIKEKILDSKDLSLSYSYYNLGNFFRLISKYDQALDYYKKVEMIYSHHFDRDNLKMGYLFWNLGSTYINKGDYENSIYYLEKSIIILKDNLAPDHSDIISVLINLGHAYEKLNQLEKALNYYGQCNESRNNLFINKSLRNTANILAQQGRNAEAEQYYLRAIDSTIGSVGEHSQDMGLCYHYYGVFLLDTGKDKAGLSYLERALKVFGQLYESKSNDITQTLLKLGKYYQDKGQDTLALSLYHQALLRSLEGFEDESVYSSPTSESLVSSVFPCISLLKKAETSYRYYIKQNDSRDYLDLAYQSIKLAILFYEKLNDSYGTEEGRIRLVNELRQSYQLAFEIINKYYELTRDSKYMEEFFLYSEKSRSSVLVSKIQDSEAKLASQIPNSLLKEENRIRVNFESFNQLIYQESQNETPDYEKITLWRNKAFVYKKQLDSLYQLYENDYPAYYSLKYERTFVTTEQVKGRLGEDELFIEYVSTDSMLYSFIISDEVSKIVRTPIHSDSLNSAILTISRYLNNEAVDNTRSGDIEIFARNSYAIFRCVLGSTDDRLNHKKLIIIPDAELSLLSFDLLLTEEAQPGAKFNSLPFLIRQNTISYAASATLMIHKSQLLSKKSNFKVLAFAPTYDHLRNGNTLGSLDTRIRAQLIPLPYVDEEVSNILDILQGTKYTGKDALKSAFIENAAKYDILHLAMHTIIDEANPLSSTLVFYTDESTNGLLYAYELYNIEINGIMAVLSACNTGSGKLEKGEGVMSLSRAFIYAGIPSIITTLWSVEDHAGSEIMTNFYTYIKQGYNKAEALRMAKLDYLDNSSDLKSHPYFWASYVVFGDTAPLDIKNRMPNSSILLLVLISLGIMITGIIIFKRRLNRKNNQQAQY